MKTLMPVRQSTAHVPKIWIWTSKIITDLWLSAVFCLIKKIKITPPYCTVQTHTAQCTVQAHTVQYRDILHRTDTCCTVQAHTVLHSTGTSTDTYCTLYTVQYRYILYTLNIY